MFYQGSNHKPYRYFFIIVSSAQYLNLYLYTMYCILLFIIWHWIYTVYIALTILMLIFIYTNIVGYISLWSNLASLHFTQVHLFKNNISVWYKRCILCPYSLYFLYFIDFISFFLPFFYVFGLLHTGDPSVSQNLSAYWFSSKYHGGTISGKTHQKNVCVWGIIKWHLQWQYSKHFLSCQSCC